MAIYVIGDVQGCYDELRQLLDEIAFEPARDRVWFVGDLINRGPKSLAVLRFVKSLGDGAVTVLGNHDLHLLALAAGNDRHAKKSNLDAVLEAPDRDELLHWLRHRPLLHHDDERQITMIHAGFPPQWDLAQARACARELEDALRGPDHLSFMFEMYGNKPDRWDPGLEGPDRLRFITNCLTRLRYCHPDGRLALKEKRALGDQSDGIVPWFQTPGRRTRGERIVFGHWSTLGYWGQDNVWGIDGGCLWGGELIALRIRRNGSVEPTRLPCTGYLTPTLTD